jgi:hypothetical protein
MTERPPVPEAMLDRLRACLADLPELREEDAWTGVCWRVGQAVVAHVFGGEDQLFRITFRGEPDEVVAFEHLGDPHFRAGWGRNVIGLLLDEHTDWEELGELLTDSFCIQAPQRLVDLVDRPA